MLASSDIFASLLENMTSEQGSDLYISPSAPPSLRVGDKITPILSRPLSEEEMQTICHDLLDAEQQEAFDHALEFNSSFTWKDGHRFRVNFYKQQLETGMVIRRINAVIPTLEELQLPAIYGQLIMQRHGLILVTGQTGVGKSTSLAAMIDHRNRHGSGHIVTIEDPIEFIHTPRQCLFTQRDIGIDTHSFHDALKHVLRQRPDVILVGEIRDAEVMEKVLAISESGHLCLATMHATNAVQAIERIGDLFPKNHQDKVLKSLSGQLKAILAQRMMAGADGRRQLALEIMLNRGAIPALIQEQKWQDIREVMLRNSQDGVQTFDQHLFKLFTEKRISEELAIAQCDNPTDFNLKLRQWRQAQGQSATLDFREQKQANPLKPN